MRELPTQELRRDQVLEDRCGVLAVAPRAVPKCKAERLARSAAQRKKARKFELQASVGEFCTPMNERSQSALDPPGRFGLGTSMPHCGRCCTCDGKPDCTVQCCMLAVRHRDRAAAGQDDTPKRATVGDVAMASGGGLRGQWSFEFVRGRLSSASKKFSCAIWIRPE